LCGLLCGSALAQPKGVVAIKSTVTVDREFDDALLVAEVTVETVAADGMDGVIRVKVTANPDRIFRGLEHLGRRMNLAAPAGGETRAADYMDAIRKKGKSVLVFVGSKGELIIGGEEVSFDNRRAYKLVGWSDFAFRRLDAVDKTFGKGEGGIGDTYTLGADEMTKRGAEQRTAFFAKTADLLGDPPALIAADEFARLLGQLASAKGEVREAAQRELASRGKYQIAAIKIAAAKATDAEVRSRLESVLEKSGGWAVAADFAVHVRELGAVHEARMLVEGVAHLDGAAKARALGRLRALAKQEGVTIFGDGDDAVIFSWRARAALAK